MNFTRPSIFLFILFFNLTLSGCNNDMEMVNFKNLNLPDKRNYYLACPENYCNVPPNVELHHYKVGVDELVSGWERMVSQQPRVHLVKHLPKEYHYQYVQYSRVFRFPDYIDVQFIPLKKHESALAVYSRARYGYYDFHVNEKRVKLWLKLLPDYLNAPIP